VSRLQPLLACYGGGHAQIIAALAKAFVTRGDQPTVIGFTTAYRELQRQGVDALNVTSLLNPTEDAEWLELAEPFTRDLSHPDIAPEETVAYFALGLRDLSDTIGRDAALARVEKEGRKAFEPISVMRRYLSKARPDIVITTTSPRFETALLKAARLEGVPNLAVGDLFLVKERDWILSPGYAEHLAVLSSEVASELKAEGFPANALRVTGNPAFDSLAVISANSVRRDDLRAQLGLAGKSVILFPAPGAQISMIGRPFLEIADVVTELEAFCSEHPDHTYLIRPHPNRPFALPKTATSGHLDDGSVLSAEDAILVSDIICVEASTMGLQAALAGRRVICIGFADYVLYPRYGLAQPADTLTGAIELLCDERSDSTGSFTMPPLGTATVNVLTYVDDILSD
jgi:hypothetical protein